MQMKIKSLESNTCIQYHIQLYMSYAVGKHRAVKPMLARKNEPKHNDDADGD